MLGKSTANEATAALLGLSAAVLALPNSFLPLHAFHVVASHRLHLGLKLQDREDACLP